MTSKISDYLYSFKNKILEANEISKQCETIIEEFANNLEKQDLYSLYEENILTILGYTFRIEDISQRLFFTFQEAVYAIDLDKLMRNEDSLKLNAIVYTFVLNFLIKEYNNQPLPQEIKQKAINTYKEIENKKSKEDKKYHMYQY